MIRAITLQLTRAASGMFLPRRRRGQREGWWWLLLQEFVVTVVWLCTAPRVPNCWLQPQRMAFSWFARLDKPNDDVDQVE
ncbi:hypothetical protein CPAR01_07348 [Colletotrichum paranaense]|uniref:Secreted protein n=1 Tax=Colletotrichum paranaense TaxID=1914294 RepID=A0ABQ9SQ85_9PEZI|nr:uncharacterized protein CPAR01_07348 [Colletotrichum paranaense]KAK1541359.1 hypothetical protein CPAR01_07348 [Colletotrichum paranaense]